MNNRLICLEGILDFEEEIRVQTINIISFNQGQPININRDSMPSGHTFSSYMSQQLDNAQKIFNQFNFVKMEEVNERDLFAVTIQIVFTFTTGNGQRVWQVTFASCLEDNTIMNFTSVYPDEESMIKQIDRLRNCVKKFKLTGS